MTDASVGARLRRAAREDAVPSRALRAEVVPEVPELERLAGTEQDPIWHPEGSVLVHALWAADLAAARCDELGLAPEARERIVITALVHDIGKPDTTRHRAGRITSHGHAERGAEIVRALLPRLGVPGERAIAAIVADHMTHLSVQGEPSARAATRLAQRLEAAGASIEEWAIVVRSDLGARGPGAKPDPTGPWLRRAGRG